MRKVIAIDKQGSEITAGPDRLGWTQVYRDGILMWAGQVDARTAVERFEEMSHPHYRPFTYTENA